MLRNIKAEMARHEKTRISMAEFLGISENSFRYKLTEKREFTLDEAARMAILFNVSIEYLAQKYSDDDIKSA